MNEILCLLIPRGYASALRRAVSNIDYKYAFDNVAPISSALQSIICSSVIF